MPRALVNRPKMGFGIPLADWLRRDYEIGAKIFCNGQAFDSGLLDPDPILKNGMNTRMDRVTGNMPFGMF